MIYFITERCAQHVNFMDEVWIEFFKKTCKNLSELVMSALDC